jgi:hypothetical protein
MHGRSEVADSLCNVTLSCESCDGRTDGRIVIQKGTKLQCYQLVHVTCYNHSTNSPPS